MKAILLFCFIVIASVGCSHKLSDSDKNYIETVISNHQMTVGLQYRMDTISHRNTIKDLNMAYDPHTDPDLTYDKFIKFCKDKDLDPVKEAKFLASREK